MEPYKPNKPWISVNLPSREELIAMAMGLIPGGRALKYYMDNPEGSALETLKLAAEDVIPFYGTYRNDGDIDDYAKEAVMLGVPMPYIKHPTTGKPIPNNLKEALGNSGYAAAKSRMSRGGRKLYSSPDDMPYSGSRENRRSSSVARVNATADARTAIDVPAGPYQATNTGSDLVNTGRQAMNTNAVPYNRRSDHTLSGTLAWQGDMYPPGRTLARLDEYGPYVWDKATDQTGYIRKLNDVINENEYKWEYLINKTRPNRTKPNSVVPKEDIVSIALSQGRPDIAARVMADNEPRISVNDNPKFTSYHSQQKPKNIPDNAKWKDIGNRQVEKELREQFAMLPEDDLMRYKFADYYGAPDLYQSWINEPELWAKYRDETMRKRVKREATIATNDRKYKRNIER